MKSRAVVNALTEVLLGAQCPGCHSPEIGLCSACRAVLDVGAGVARHKQMPVSWAGHYCGALRNLILAAKERKALGMIKPLGDLMASAIVPLLPTTPATFTIVPVPTAKRNVIERGIDLPLALSQRAAGELKRIGHQPQVVSALGFQRKPADQSRLSVLQRQENLYRAFIWQAHSTKTPVIVVDDIYTTGATMGEAVRATREAGIMVAGTACVARTPRRV